MSFFGFFKNPLPSFEDDFVQSESERVLENAPASARGRVRQDFPSVEEENYLSKDGTTIPFSVDLGVSLFPDN